MNSINTITFTGRCGKDPEIRFFDDGKAVARLNLAVSRKFKGEEEVFWVEVSIWGKTAQNASDYIKKGTLVGVTGRMEPAEAWIDKQGNARASIKITANGWEILRQPGDGSASGRGGYGQDSYSQGSRSLEELPF